MKTIKVIVSAYVSTMQTVEVKDDFDVNDENFMYDLAHLDHIQGCLRENVEVVLISDAETNECYYEQ